MIKKPFVVVSVLNFNGKEILRDCLSSMLALEYPNFKVIMVDNGSTDNSKEFVEKEFPSVIVIRTEKNLGYSGGMNLGLKYAFDECNADYCLYVNNDTKIDKFALSYLIDAAESLKNQKAGFLTGKVYYMDNPGILQTVGISAHPFLWYKGSIGEGEKDQGQYEKIEERIFLDDIYMLVKREVYKDVGGFDEAFFCHSEEIDWQARAKSKGWKFYYVPGAKIWHKHSYTIGPSSPRSVYFAIRSRILAIYRNKGFLFFIRFLIYLFYYACRNAFGQIRKKRYKPALAIIIGYFSGLLWLVHKKKGEDVPKFLR
ncbi:MAG: glycosyltransferase family 2 protein [Ignavibacteria bacterium]|nr:glycosyltransferase family 2 protein [Ignavibacteria bacterium]